MVKDPRNADLIKPGCEWGGGGLHRTDTKMTADSSRERNLFKFDSYEMIDPQRLWQKRSNRSEAPTVS